TFTYTPNANAIGDDTFTYTASDPNGVSNTATVTFTISNPPPIANSDSYSVSYNTPLTISTVIQGILGNDSDLDGEAIHVTNPGTIVTPKGQVALNADGTLVYTPNNGAAGVDSFIYTASDANGVSNTAIVTFTIANPPPVAGNDS